MIFEHRSAVDMRVNEHRSTENQSGTAGIVELATDSKQVLDESARLAEIISLQCMRIHGRYDRFGQR
ncbi:MAG: hypothetical protein K0S27_558 [Gammaproteobacteria bacterium]|nr:hypothetical protein [Gammaproteobacteria bacterium]